MDIHQVAKFSSNPKSCHNKVVKRIGEQLFRTRDEGLTHAPNKEKDLDTFVDADFAGRFNIIITEYLEHVNSRKGFIVKHTGYPITCKKIKLKWP